MLIYRNLKKSEISEICQNRGFEQIVVESKSGNISTLKLLRQDLNTKLYNHGVVILKGFNINSFEEYESIFDILNINLSREYRPGIAPRVLKSKSGKSFSSTEASKDLCITPHNEMAYSNYRPSILSFWCKKKPLKYGETPLFDCSKIIDKISSISLVNKVTQPIIYTRRFSNIKTDWDIKGSNVGGSTWEASFNTSNKKIIENYCRKIGMYYKWDNDILNTSIKIDSVLKNGKCNCLQLQTPILGDEVYYDMIKRFPSRFDNERFHEIIKKNKYVPDIKYKFMNETLLSKYEVEKYINSVWATSIIPRWESNDVWIINNIKCAHARMNVFSSNREIVASMGDFVDIRESKHSCNPMSRL